MFPVSFKKWCLLLSSPQVHELAAAGPDQVPVPAAAAHQLPQEEERNHSSCVQQLGAHGCSSLSP